MVKPDPQQVKTEAQLFHRTNELAVCVRSLPPEWVVHLYHLLVHDDWLTDHTNGLLTMVHWEELGYEPGVLEPFSRREPDDFKRRCIMKELGYQHQFFRTEFVAVLDSGLKTGAKYQVLRKKYRKMRRKYQKDRRQLQPKKAPHPRAAELMAEVMKLKQKGVKGRALLEQANRLKVELGIPHPWKSNSSLAAQIRRYQRKLNQNGASRRTAG